MFSPLYFRRAHPLAVVLTASKDLTAPSATSSLPYPPPQQDLPLTFCGGVATVSAAALLSAGAMAFEGADLVAAGERGVGGWAMSSYLPRILYLALVPGILGHQGTTLLPKVLMPFDMLALKSP